MKPNKELFQYDINQSLSGCTGKYIDFIINDDVFRVQVENETCLIPDELLQVEGDHTVYQTYEDGTISEHRLFVYGRPKPADYVYTPTERLTFEGLVQKVDDAVADMIRKAESGEFDGHTPVKGTDYFTTEEIQQIQNEVSSGAIGKFKTVVDTETETFNINAETKLNAYNQNDSQKTNVYNTNATEKLNAYNTNADNRVAEFDSHTGQIQADISGLKSDLVDNVYLQKPFEIGNFYVDVDSWDYNSSDKRVRTPVDVTITLNKGDVVGLSDYSDARYFIAWKKPDGSHAWEGWLTSDYTITEGGEYVILISNITEKTQTDATALSSLLEINKVFHAVDYADRKETNDIIYSKLGCYLDSLTYNEYDGYIASNGTANVNTTYGEKYSDMIHLPMGTQIKMSGKFSETRVMWLAVASYDKDRNFIRRSVILLDAVCVTFDAEYVVEPNEYYVVLTYRTYNDLDLNTTYKTENNYHLINDAVNGTASILESDINYRVNKNVKSVNHRGFNTVAPENTLSAYRLSKKMGFDYVETDVSFTSDGVAVCLHDDTIDRTSNGTGAINELTFEQVRSFDFGAWKSEEYTGEVIPSFEEFILLCKNLGLHPYIEFKSSASYTETQIRGLVDIVKRYGMKGKVTWISFSSTLLGYVKNYDDNARLGFVVGSIDDNVVTTALSLKTNNNEVFIDTSYGLLTTDGINLCVNADIPLEVWTIDNADSLYSLNEYVTGVTSDSLLSGSLLIKNNL